MAALPLTDQEYRALSSAVLAGIEATVDRLLEDDVIDIDAHRTGGLLELDMGQDPAKWAAGWRGTPLAP